MTGDTVTVRPATAEDAPAIASLHIRSWQWAYRGQLPDEFLDDLSSALVRREQQWMQWLSQPGSSFTLVAVKGLMVVGFVHGGKARAPDLGPDAAEIYSIYLERDAVGQGIGRKLFGEAVDGLAERGYRSAVLWVLEGNTRGRRFYEAAGWKPDGKQQPIELGGFTTTEVRYGRDLPGPAV